MATWELGVAGDYQKTTIAKQVAVAVRTDASGYDVAFRTAAPVLAKPEGVPALEALALRLAAVYENVVVHAAPTGEFQHLLNHDHLVRTWAALRADLCANIADGDALTPVLLAQVDRELADPARVLRSLAHDYVYRALVSPVYGEVLEATRVYSQAREFSQFFPNASVWFREN